MLIIKRISDDLSVAYIVIGTTVIEEITLNNKERATWQPLVRQIMDGTETVHSTKLRAFAV